MAHQPNKYVKVPQNAIADQQALLKKKTLQSHH